MVALAAAAWLGLGSAWYGWAPSAPAAHVGSRRAARNERGARGFGRQRQVLLAQRLGLPLGVLERSHASRNDVVAGHDNLIARRHLP